MRAHWSGQAFTVSPKGKRSPSTWNQIARPARCARRTFKRCRAASRRHRPRAAGGTFRAANSMQRGGLAGKWLPMPIDRGHGGAIISTGAFHFLKSAHRALQPSQVWLQSCFEISPVVLSGKRHRLVCEALAFARRRLASGLGQTASEESQFLVNPST
jgi:hypothetical protein